MCMPYYYRPCSCLAKGGRRHTIAEPRCSASLPRRWRENALACRRGDPDWHVNCLLTKRGAGPGGARHASISCAEYKRASMTKYKLEYIWLDGYTPTPNLRGKTQIKEFAEFPTLEQLPLWGFDGS